MELIEIIESVAKDGTDLTEIKGQIEGLNPLNGLKSKEDAWEMIKSNKLMLSAFDSEQGKRAESVLENFKSGKMQEAMAEREAELRLELNPEESEASKVAREFNDFKSTVQAKEDLAALKDSLSNRAKELAFDPIDAREFSGFGENAMMMLEKFATRENERVNNRLNTEIKEKFSMVQPKVSNILPADIDTKIREAKEAGNAELSLKLLMRKNASETA